MFAVTWCIAVYPEALLRPAQSCSILIYGISILCMLCFTFVECLRPCFLLCWLRLNCSVIKTASWLATEWHHKGFCCLWYGNWWIFSLQNRKKIFFFSFLPLKCTQIEQRGPNTFQHLFPCFIKAGKLGVSSSTLMFSTVVMKHIKKWWIWQRHEDGCRVAAANPHTFVGNRSWTQTRHSV